MSTLVSQEFGKEVISFLIAEAIKVNLLEGSWFRLQCSRGVRNGVSVPGNDFLVLCAHN